MNLPGGTETRSYNTLNQLSNLKFQQTIYPDNYLENLTYNYPTGSNIGKINSMSNAISGETITYTYDSLNRLLTADGSGWGEQYGFDGFGNLLSKTVTAGSGPSLSIAVNPLSNQIQGVSGLSYDANGNQNAGSYDAENRLVAVGTTQYSYDAQNRRIWSWAGSTDLYNQGNPDAYLVSLYSPGGQKLATYEISAFNTATSGLTLISLSTLTGGDQYFGSRRLAVIDQLGSAVSYTSPVTSYFPWGETKGTSNPQNTWNFATYWQDSVSGLDYANNRYYSNGYGRFTTPDPFSNSGRLNEPQSWNRYDPSGLLPICSGGLDVVYDGGGGDDDFAGASCGSEPNQGWGCDSVYVMTAVGGMQMPGPCYFLPVLPVLPVAAGCVGSYTSARKTFYTCFHQSGSDWNNLATTLKQIEKKLQKDPKCDSFLTSSGLSMADINNDLLNPYSTFTLAGAIVSISTGNVLAGTTFDVPSQTPIIINSYAFQKSNQPTNYLTILHELAHLAAVIPPDGTPASSAANDLTVELNCFKTIGIPSPQ